MDLFTQIQYLFFSIEHENMQHSERMDKLRELINKNNKIVLNDGVRIGLNESKEMIALLIRERYDK